MLVYQVKGTYFIGAIDYNSMFGYSLKYTFTSYPKGNYTPATAYSLSIGAANGVLPAVTYYLLWYISDYKCDYAAGLHTNGYVWYIKRI